CALSRPEVACGSQTRREADAGIREHAGVRLERRTACGAALLRPRGTIPSCGESWWSRIAGYSSDLQFALQHDERRIAARGGQSGNGAGFDWFGRRSEEHTSELQSRSDLVCRLLLEKKK